MTKGNGQRGVALLTVLLVVFLASTAAVGLATLENLSLRRHTLFSHQQQARYYLLGAEQWATRILSRDRAQGDVDSLDEDWASIPPVFPIEGGTLSGRLVDLQGRFNLNSLLDGDSIDPAQLAYLRRLLEARELNPGLAEAIADWLDPDQETRFPDGAEDANYVAADPPYLAANRPFVSVTELRLVQGMDADSYRQLAPLLSALPATAGLNLNTASPELLQPLVAAGNPPLLAADRDLQGWEPLSSVDEFLATVTLAEPPVNPARLTVGSGYFLLIAEAQVGDARGRLQTLLERQDNGETRAIRRSFGADW